VLYGADGQYLLGAFDGKRFTPEGGKQRLWHGNFYAAQTFSNAPDGRCIQIGWGQGITFPDMPFNQQMMFPCELTLRTTEDGVRLFAEPVKEIERLHAKTQTTRVPELTPGDGPVRLGEGELFDIRAEVEVGKAAGFGLTVRGVALTWDVKKGLLSCQGRTAPLKPIKGQVRLRVLVDRGSIEVFGNDGAVALSVGVLLPQDNKRIELFSRGGVLGSAMVRAQELRSAW
jgi:sucrose-6-phosphate hydrolase SacC (GH32 family)